jgi:hypothetical protein
MVRTASSHAVEAELLTTIRVAACIAAHKKKGY